MIFQTLQNMLDIPANNCQLQVLLSTPTHLSGHADCNTRSYGRTSTKSISFKHKVFIVKLTNISLGESIKAIIHIIYLQAWTPPVQWKLAICYNTVDPVVVVTRTNTMVSRWGNEDIMGKTLRFSLQLILFTRSLVKSNSPCSAHYNSTTCVVFDGQEVSDLSP